MAAIRKGGTRPRLDTVRAKLFQSWDSLRFADSYFALCWQWAGGIRIEVFEVRELVKELVAQARIGEHFPVTVAFAALHE